MTQRMFVCHAKSDIEITSEIVDSLETALELSAGALSASSLPGYASELIGEGDLHATLTGASVMLALFTERSTYDPEFVFELGAAWALGIDVIPLLLGAARAADLPWPLRDRPTVQPQEASAWAGLITLLAQRLQVPQRVSGLPAVPQLDFDLEPARRNSVSIVAPVVIGTPPDPEPLPEALLSPPMAATEPDPEPELVPAVQPPPQAASPALYDSPLHLAPPPDESSERELPFNLPSDAFEPKSDVRSSLPTYRMSLEAGRALSDCVFNRAEALDFRRELEEPFGRFVDAVGGSWKDLRELQDFDVWLSVTENLLRSLPNEGKRIADWYEVGYELAILHNLAGQGLFDDEQRAADAEQLWRDALERFLSRAENAEIPYEHLARVMSLIENLVAPQAERDLANIARSLDELRTQAIGADQNRAA